MTFLPIECSEATTGAPLSNRSISYTEALTDRSTGVVSCHCHAVPGAGIHGPELARGWGQGRGPRPRSRRCRGPGRVRPAGPVPGCSSAWGLSVEQPHRGPASGQRTPVPCGSGGGIDACGLPTPGDSLAAARDFKRKDDAWCGGSFGRALGLGGRPWQSILAETCPVAGFVARAHAISMPVPHAVFVGVSLVLDWVLGPRALRQRPDHEHPVNEC